MPNIFHLTPYFKSKFLEVFFIKFTLTFMQHYKFIIVIRNRFLGYSFHNNPNEFPFQQPPLQCDYFVIMSHRRSTLLFPLQKISTTTS